MPRLPAVLVLRQHAELTLDRRSRLARPGDPAVVRLRADRLFLRVRGTRSQGCGQQGGGKEWEDAGGLHGADQGEPQLLVGLERITRSPGCSRTPAGMLLESISAIVWVGSTEEGRTRPM